jgi:hypothetical protein
MYPQFFVVVYFRRLFCVDGKNLLFQGRGYAGWGEIRWPSLTSYESGRKFERYFWCKVW